MQPSLELYDMSVWDHLVAAVICIFAPILALTSRRINAEDIRFDPEDKIKLYHSNALLLFVFALVVITTWRIPGRTLAGLGLTWPQWNTWVILLLVVVFLFYLLDLFFQYGLRRWRARTFQQRTSSLTFVPENGRELMHFLFLSLAAGIGEEIVFRGYLMHYLVYWAGNTLMGLMVTAFFSSALFAFLHGYQGMLSMLKIFFLALLFSAIFIMSQSLLLVMIVHAVIDMLSGWIGIHLLREMRHEESRERDN